MTNERAVEILNLDLDILGQYGGESAEAYKMAIKALEQQTCIEDYPTCTECEHYDKDKHYCPRFCQVIKDTLAEAQPKTEIENLKTEIEKLKSEMNDLISREDAEMCVTMEIKPEDTIETVIGRVHKRLKDLPPVTPQASEEDIHREREQAYMLGLEDASKRFRTEPCEDCISRQAVLDIINFEDKWLFDANGHNANTHIAFSGLESRVKALPSVKPKYTDEEIDKAQAVEQAYVDKMVELAVKETERPKGKWIDVLEHRDEFGSTWHYECSECRGRSYKGVEPLERYCPNCGAEMEVEE